MSRRRPRWLGLVLLLAGAAVGAFFFLSNKPGELVVTSEPAANVQLLIDNERQPVDGTPATLKLKPGSYVLTVQREGYVPWNGEVEIKGGEILRKRVVLEPLSSGTGFTLISDPPAAQAILDGRTLENRGTARLRHSATPSRSVPSTTSARPIARMANAAAPRARHSPIQP